MYMLVPLRLVLRSRSLRSHPLWSAHSTGRRRSPGRGPSRGPFLRWGRSTSKRSPQRWLRNSNNKHEAKQKQFEAAAVERPWARFRQARGKMTDLQRLCASHGALRARRWDWGFAMKARRYSFLKQPTKGLRQTPVSKAYFECYEGTPATPTPLGVINSEEIEADVLRGSFFWIISPRSANKSSV